MILSTSYIFHHFDPNYMPLRLCRFQITLYMHAVMDPGFLKSPYVYITYILLTPIQLVVEMIYSRVKVAKPLADELWWLGWVFRPFDIFF